MTDLYYTAPKDSEFDELKQKTIEIWETYDNEFGYVDEKVSRIKDLKNIGDNFMHMIGMFDTVNQEKLADKLGNETRQAARERLLDGGQPLAAMIF